MSLETQGVEERFPLSMQIPSCMSLNNSCLCPELVLHSWFFLKSEMGIRSISNMFLPRMSNFSHETKESQNKQSPLKGGLDCLKWVCQWHLKLFSSAVSHYSGRSSIWVSMGLGETRGHSGVLCEGSRLPFRGSIL